MYQWTPAVRRKVFNAAEIRMHNAMTNYSDLISYDEFVSSEHVMLKSLHSSCFTRTEEGSILSDDDLIIREFRAHARQFAATCRHRQKLYEKRGLIFKLKAIIALRNNVYQAYQRLIDNDPRLRIRWIEAREALRQCGKTPSFSSLCNARQKICQVKADCKRRDARNASLAANPVLGFQLG